MKAFIELGNLHNNMMIFIHLEMKIYLRDKKYEDNRTTSLRTSVKEKFSFDK